VGVENPPTVTCHIAYATAQNVKTEQEHITLSNTCGYLKTKVTKCGCQDTVH